MAGSLEVNKALGAVLTAGLVFMVATVASDYLVNPKVPEKLAITVEGVQEEGAAPQEAAAAGPPEVPIAVALQTADPKAGDATAHKLCIACHSFEEGAPAKVGPNLYGVVGGPHAHMPGFDYSAAIKAKQGPWTFDELNQWLTSPRTYAPGTKMAFAGIGNEKERANVIDYLRTLSPNPEPLPPAPAGDPGRGGGRGSPCPACQLERRRAAACPGPARRSAGVGGRPDEPARAEPEHAAGAAESKPGRAGHAGRHQPALNPEELVAAAEAAADAAGATIRPWYRARLGAEIKADLSPVTAADRAAEHAMRTLLSERFPDHGILGEEAGLIRPAARLRWVLDPIDGTRAFITGRPLFGTLIALMDGDEPLLGVLDQPVLGERWVGVRGQATRFRGAYGRAGCRPCARLAEAELGCTTPAMLTGTNGAGFARLQESGLAHDLGRRLLRLRPGRAGDAGRRRRG